MAGTLASIRADLTKFVDQAATDSLKHVAGGAAKNAALDVAERDAGGDRALSGFRRKSARLNAGYDIGSGSSLTLNLSPKGLWTLMNTGRRAGAGRVYPKKRNGAKVLNTPWGPRASVRSSSWGGKGTLTDAERAIEVETFKAVDREMVKRIGGF